jgi:hypothetical protein
VVCALSLLVLFLLTALNCILPLSHWIKRIDKCKLITCWLLFSPEPWLGDLRFVYQETYVNGAKGPWRDMGWWTPRNSFAFAWNPGLRLKATLIEIIIMMDYVRMSGGNVFESTPYRMLLDAARRRCSKSSRVQFAVFHNGLQNIGSPTLLRVASPLHDVS